VKSSLFQVLLAIFLSCTLHAQKAVEDEKLEYYRSVMGQGLRDDNPKQIAKGYYLLGKYEEKMNNFTEAYRLLIYALTISENIKDYKNFEKAKQYAQEAIRQSSLYNLPKRLRSSYSHMGNIYLEYSRWTDSTFSSAASDSALYFFSKVESLATSEKTITNSPNPGINQALYICKKEIRKRLKT
jgi:tetratricopeptide (TPR) repeat protein